MQSGLLAAPQSIEDGSLITADKLMTRQRFSASNGPLNAVSVMSIWALLSFHLHSFVVCLMFCIIFFSCS